MPFGLEIPVLARLLLCIFLEGSLFPPKRNPPKRQGKAQISWLVAGMHSIRDKQIDRYQAGVTLVELMVALALGLFLLAGGLLVYSRALQGSADNMSMNYLDEQLRASAQIMTRDIRRAGYWGVLAATVSTGNLAKLVDNPFRQIVIGNDTGESSDSCILFSYDLNDDGYVGLGGSGTVNDATIENKANMEQFGYRLHNGFIEMRTGGSAFGCTAGTWQPMTDSSITVSKLTFTQTATQTEILNASGGTAGQCVDNGDTCLQQRSIELDIDGRLSSDTSSTESIRNTVDVRNDCYYVYGGSGTAHCPGLLP